MAEVWEEKAATAKARAAETAAKGKVEAAAEGEVEAAALARFEFPEFGVPEVDTRAAAGAIIGGLGVAASITEADLASSLMQVGGEAMVTTMLAFVLANNLVFKKDRDRVTASFENRKTFEDFWMSGAWTGKDSVAGRVTRDVWEAFDPLGINGSAPAPSPDEKTPDSDGGDGDDDSGPGAKRELKIKSKVGDGFDGDKVEVDVDEKGDASSDATVPSPLAASTRLSDASLVGSRSTSTFSQKLVHLYCESPPGVDPRDPSHYDRSLRAWQGGHY